MRNLGYYNGKYDLIENMTIPMGDRGNYFGDGVYDVAYSRNHIVYSLGEHIDRFFYNASLLKIRLDITKEELETLINELVMKVDDGEQNVYWQVTRGTALRNHPFPPEDVKSNLTIMLTPCKIRDTYRKIRLISAEDTRFLHCNIKTLNLIPSVITSQMSADAGVDECVLHRSGRVTECSHSNISIIKAGVLITAPADNLILPGVGRAHLIAKCREFGYEVKEIPYSLDELKCADEIIVTSAGSLCLAAYELDGEKIGGKNPGMLKKLQDALLGDYIDKTEKNRKS